MSESQKYDWQSWRKQQELERQGRERQYKQQRGQEREQQLEQQRGQERSYRGSQEDTRYSEFEYQATPTQNISQGVSQNTAFGYKGASGSLRDEGSSTRNSAVEVSKLDAIRGISLDSQNASVRSSVRGGALGGLGAGTGSSVSDYGISGTSSSALGGGAQEGSVRSARTQRPAARSHAQNKERELYDYSQAAIRSEWGSQHAEESAELVHRATVAAGGYKTDEPRVKLRKESEFPSSVMAPYREDDGTRQRGISRASRSNRGSFSVQDEPQSELQNESRATQRGESYEFVQRRARGDRARNTLPSDARQEARERVARRRSGTADMGATSVNSAQLAGEQHGRVQRDKNQYDYHGARRDSGDFANSPYDRRSARSQRARSSQSEGSYGANQYGGNQRGMNQWGENRRSNIQPKRSKKPFIIAGIVLLVALLAVGGYALATNLGSSNSDNSQPAADEQLNASDTKQVAAPVSDNLVMNLNGDSDTIVLKGEDYIESGCHVINKQTGANLTNQVKTEGSVDTSKAGDYSVTYSVADEAGATCLKERTVHVVDSMDADTDGISVLMYHYVYTDSDRPDDLNGNYILDTDLDAQLAWLESEDYYYPSYEELSAYIAGTHSLPQKSVVVTFDDGETGFLKYGIPLLEKHKVPATSFVIASDADAADKVKNYASEYVSFQSHSYAMHQAGSDVGRGGRIHAMTQEEILDDLQKAADIVQNNEAMAYPFGDNNETAHAAIRQAGILCAFTIINDQVRPGDDPTCLSRVRISGEYSLDGFTYSVENGVG